MKAREREEKQKIKLKPSRLNRKREKIVRETDDANTQSDIPCCSVNHVPTRWKNAKKRMKEGGK